MGSYLSTYPKTESNITGRVALVIGANRGIGFQTAKQLYELGATVYLGCRDEAKALEAIKRIRADVTGSDGQLKWLPADVSSIKKAKESAEAFLGMENQLDILVHNAATGNQTYELNEEGIELNMAIHHFGPFVFTKVLLNLMKHTSAKPGSDVRIVCVNSIAHEKLASYTVTFNDEEDLVSKPFPPTDYNTWGSWLARYGRSKLANLLFARELQQQLDAEGSSIIVISLHPGSVRTDTALHSVGSIPTIGPVARIIAGFTFMDEATGALNTLFAATNPVVRAEPEKYKGKYLMPVGKITAPSGMAQDDALAKRVWDMSEKVVEAKSMA